MTGAGARGPVPKRNDQRRRRNSPAGPSVTKAPASAKVPTRPEADESWHPIAREWFDSLGESGQSTFYEASDWATARYLAEAMSRNLAAGRFSATLFAAVMSGMTELLTTEGARRRARVELQRAEPEQPASVALMARYRDAARP